MPGQPFGVPVQRNPKIPEPESSNWFWNPNRVGAYAAPAWFNKKLREVDPDECVSVNWNPYTERWQVWYKKPSFQHKICQGWVLLFPVCYADDSYMPLDERVLARLYSASAQQWGDGKKYFAAIEREMEREREKREAQQRQDAIDQAMPYWEHSQIKNIGKGNKFSTYHQ